MGVNEGGPSGAVPASTSFYFSRSVVFRTEIGTSPRRDRSVSAAKSVEFRTEIGRTPCRDRSSSASRSVRFRLEFVVGWLCGMWCAWWVWLSLVLHMGGWGPCRTAAGFCWNDGLSWWAWCVVVGLPCAMRGVCAHGNPTMTATDNAVPHDSAVPAGVGRARVCNINCGGMRGYGDGAGRGRRAPPRAACLAHAGISQSRLTAVRPDSSGLQPREPPHREPPPKHSPLSQMS